MRPFFGSFRRLVFVALFLLAASSTESAAVKPFITVSPSWRPPKELTTIDVNGNGVTDPGDDIRYAAVDIFVTTNVEFSAVGFTCTVNRLALESYVQNGDPNSVDDAFAMFTDGADWGTTLTTTADTTDTDGKFGFAISVSQPFNPPLGQEGVTQTLHVATLRYRVKEGLTAAATSPFSCMAAFYDGDATPLPAAKFLPASALGIAPGYTVSGRVIYQGISVAPTAAQAINVFCDDSDADSTFNDVVTNVAPSTGLFQVANLRTPGRYDCQFVGNIVTPGVGADLHLMGVTDFHLATANLSLLPVALKAGNVNRTAFSATQVDGSDLAMVTSNWNVPQSLPFQSGDANGDRKVNEADLALVGVNFGTSEPVRAHHLIYSLPRDEFAFQNSRIWSGTIHSASVRRFVPGTSRDYWPAVSPDGAKIAFVRNVGTNGRDKFALFVAPVSKGVVGTAKRITPPSDPYDAFAPAWSPDGSQLAFVCSYNQAWLDASTASGHLCLIDGNGRHFRRPIEANVKRPVSVKVQSPAWVSAQRIYIALSTDPEFPFYDNRLLMLTLPNYVYSNPGALSNGCDMPDVRDTLLGPTLFYRFDDGAGNRTIRFAQISPLNGLPFASYPNSTAGSMHEDVAGGVFPGGTPLSSDVDYFRVSAGAVPEIFFYESDPAGGIAGGNRFFIRVFMGTASAPSWSAITVVSYAVSNALGNPDFTSDYNHALRNTVAFVP